MSLLIEKIEDNTENETEKELLNNYTNETRHGYCYYGEKRVCLPSHFESIYRKVLDFEVRDDDTFVITFPKTGTTWSQEMTWLIGNNLDYEGAKVPLLSRFPFMEIQGLFANDESTEWMGPDILNSLECAANMPSPRFIKCHLPWQLLPEQIQKGTKSPKIIYTCRNPKDCLVSYYHHAVILEGYKGGFDEFFKSFINNTSSYTPFWGHLLDFWKRRHNENILILRFEDMKADLPKVIKKVAAFLGKSYNEGEMKKLATHLSFDSMKNNPAVNYEDLLFASRASGKASATGNFMRSGKVGSFKVQMSPEQIAEIDKWSEEAIRGTDFEPFPV